MTSSSSTPPLLYQPPTVAAAVKVSSVAILHFLSLLFGAWTEPGKSARQVLPEYPLVQSWFQGKLSLCKQMTKIFFFFFCCHGSSTTLCTRISERDFKFKRKSQQEGCGILTGTESLNIDGFYPANKADNNREESCFMIELTNWY